MSRSEGRAKDETGGGIRVSTVKTPWKVGVDKPRDRDTGMGTLWRREGSSTHHFYRDLPL